MHHARREGAIADDMLRWRASVERRAKVPLSRPRIIATRLRYAVGGLFILVTIIVEIADVTSGWREEALRDMITRWRYHCRYAIRVTPGNTGYCYWLPARRCYAELACVRCCAQVGAMLQVVAVTERTPPPVTPPSRRRLPRAYRRCCHRHHRLTLSLSPPIKCSNRWRHIRDAIQERLSPRHA